MISPMRVLSSQQCLTARFDHVRLCRQTAGSTLRFKQIYHRQLTANVCEAEEEKSVVRRMKVEELTSFSQETKSIHVAVVADLSQLLSRTKVEDMNVCLLV